MFGLFQSKPLLDQTDFDFQIETYQWLLKNVKQDDFFHNRKLILPTEDFFPGVITREDDIASTTFETVKLHAGMEKFKCKLVAQEKDIDPSVVADLRISNTELGPNGTFQFIDKDTNTTITYNPNIVNDPVQLVSTFAHELAHYFTIGASDSPPGGWENWEFATDITASFLGFGVFMCNSAKNFSQFTSAGVIGWKMSNNGYLTEAEHCMALALFLSLKKIPVDKAIGHLKPHLRKWVKRAAKDIDKGDVVNKLLPV